MTIGDHVILSVEGTGVNRNSECGPLAPGLVEDIYLYCLRNLVLLALAEALST